MNSRGNVSNAFKHRALTSRLLLLLLLLLPSAALLLLLLLLAVFSAWLEMASPLTASNPKPFSCMMRRGA
jgi:hypothetical protein